ncbi:MAG: hypothetical protein IPN17_13215 [Deltaproteobacteria bacterium]|nr:hypothetical protein [Deltaproteobacteria bacterium]
MNALARSPMRARVIAMARYMSRWASWRGDDGEAGHWTTLAEAAERDFAISPIATIMAVLTLNPDAFAEPAPALPPGRVRRLCLAALEAARAALPEVAATESRHRRLEGTR